MKDAIAIVYTGAHEEIRPIIAGREFTVQRNGKPLKVDKAVALELLARKADWICAEEEDQTEVEAYFAEQAEEARKKSEAAAPATKPTEPEDPDAPIDATTPKQ
jgi:hypothetical protein